MASENRMGRLLAKWMPTFFSSPYGSGDYTTNGAQPHGVKSTGSGVQWVGNPDFRAIIKLNATVDPDADELSRGIALATSAYCYTASMYRAAKVSEPPLYIAREDDDDGETVLADHELVFLFETPSPDFDMQELLALTELYLLTTGSCAWVKMRDPAGRVSRLQPFSGDEIKTFSADGRIYGRFSILTSGGIWRPYLPEDIVYFRELNPNSWRTGLSKLDVALSQLDLGHQVNRTVRNFMRKAMFPGGVVSPDKDWDPEDDEWLDFKNTIEAWYGGPAAAGQPLVLQGGATFSRAAIPLKELLPTELLDRIEAVVSSVYGIPPIVLGWKIGLENSPWSQMAQARASAYEETIIPRWNWVTKKMARQMLSTEEIAVRTRIHFDLTDIAALRADDQARATVVSTLVNEWTRNERRIYTGQEPLPEDDPRGDEIGTSSGGGGGLFELDDRGGLGGVGGLMSVGDDQGLVKMFSAEYAPDVDVKKLEGKALEWAMFDLNTKAAESTWQRAVTELLKDQARQIIRLMGQHIRPAKADGVDPDSATEFIQALAKWTREKGELELARGLYPLVVSTGTTGVKRAAAQVGLEFAVLQPGLLTYAKEEAEFLASVMGETTGKRVAKIVQDQLAQGGLVADIRKALQTSAAFSRQRAQLVARTETTRAWNGAQRRSLSEYERSQDETVRIFKEWVTAGDARVRDDHDAINGNKIRVDAQFSNGLLEPSEPNCRCTLVYSLETVGA